MGNSVISLLPSFSTSPLIASSPHPRQALAILNIAQNVPCSPTPLNNCTCCVWIGLNSNPFSTWKSLHGVPLFPCPCTHSGKDTSLFSLIGLCTHLLCSTILSSWVHLLVCEFLIHHCTSRTLHSA
jgi:hypothetical protein